MPAPASVAESASCRGGLRAVYFWLLAYAEANNEPTPSDPDPDPDPGAGEPLAALPLADPRPRDAA